MTHLKIFLASVRIRHVLSLLEITEVVVDLVVLMDAYIIEIGWKVIQIDFLDVGGYCDGNQKLRLPVSLKLMGFWPPSSTRGKYKKGTVRSWIQGTVTTQLKSYVTSTAIQERVEGLKLCVHHVLVVRSCQLIVWEMDGNGKLNAGPVLVKASGHQRWDRGRKGFLFLFFS
jgi:hypothetical protein